MFSFIFSIICFTYHISTIWFHYHHQLIDRLLVTIEVTANEITDCISHIKSVWRRLQLTKSKLTSSKKQQQKQTLVDITPRAIVDSAYKIKQSQEHISVEDSQNENMTLIMAEIFNITNLTFLIVPKTKYQKNLHLLLCKSSRKPQIYQLNNH